MKTILFFTLFMSITLPSEAKLFKSTVIESVKVKKEIILPSKKTIVVSSVKNRDHDCELLARNFESREIRIAENSILPIGLENVRSGVYRLEPGYPEVETITFIPFKAPGINVEIAIKCQSSIFSSVSEASYYVLAPNKAIKLFANDLEGIKTKK